MAKSGDDYCFGCGKNNPIGLHLNFQPDGEKVSATKILSREYEGYQDVVHGGIICLLLDEAMGNYIQKIYDKQAMTGRIEIRYRHPTPVEQELKISAWQESRRKNVLAMKASVETADGTITAEATSKFVLVSL